MKRHARKKLLRCMSPMMAQGGHLRRSSNHDSYLVVQRTRD
jgi:hypothetical protein